MGPDFKGYATKAGLKCTDGRTITAEAFKHMHGMTVPLVWQHGHDKPTNVLGHVILHAVADGVRCEGYFNDTPEGITAKALVKHKDIKNLSIYANQLVEKMVSGSKQVLHGEIREVSLVIAGANKGAVIDYVAIKHGPSPDDIEVLENEAIIHTGLDFDFISHEDDDDFFEHAGEDDTLQDVYDSLDEAQKNLLHYMIGVALEGQGEAAQSGITPPAEPDKADSTTAEGSLTHQEGNTTVTKNVFEGNAAKKDDKYTLSHDDIRGIVANAKKPGQTLKTAVEDYALAHGIDDIDLLFPDFKSITERPEWNKRRTEWVAGVLAGTRKSPFSRIKTLIADLTFEAARAKGYIKGSLKKEQFFGLTKRTTKPTTIYKKQKLDRDDIIDITDFDVVAWMKVEMRFMLEEEIARAILIGDGRAVEDEDKVKDPVGAVDGEGIRSIANDDDLYAPTFFVNLTGTPDYLLLVEKMLRARRHYKGTGTPTLYTTNEVLTEMLLLRDGEQRRYFRSVEELAAELRVDRIVEVEAMESDATLIGIIVNLQDYNVGADKGGEISLFDDFDIDYNQLKYLIETRVSGALVKIKSALVFRKVDTSDTLVTPAAPTQSDDEVTIVNTTGATYKVAAFTGAVTYNASPVTVGQTVTASFPIVLPDGGNVTIEATPTDGTYYFADNVNDEWYFTYEA